MTTFVIGCLGAIIVLGLFGSGVYVGWAVRTYMEERIDEKAEELRPATPSPQEMTPAQIQRFREDQEAFETMLHYSSDMAYGITSDPLEQFAKKET